MPRNFRDLYVYKMAHKFVLEVYPIVKSFPECESNNLVSQIRRAATSLPLNVAEGASDRSDKCFLMYLNFAYRSTKELEACFELAFDLGYVSKEVYSKILHDLETLAVKFYRFMCVLENKPSFKRNTRNDYNNFEKIQLDQKYSVKE
ncbi:four helix bundle protein [Candidatus Woesearchaeota archaeon]|nr:four helix bundle protein [Candidatus Woesearchaeota archaeon]